MLNLGDVKSVAAVFFFFARGGPPFKNHTGFQ